MSSVRPSDKRRMKQTHNDSSTSSDESPTTTRYYEADNRKLHTRNFYKSMNNITDYDTSNTRIQNSISNIDLSLHRDELMKFDNIQIPIVGYEVMEERARFTIYKLKVQDDKSEQCWLVFRRYTDFVRLYSRIKAQYPSMVLPLPGKRWFRDNFEPAFLDERVRGLQVFVNAILKKLPNHPLIREFFCLDEPPQVFSYQPEVQAVYGALEDSISTLKMQLKQKDATILHLQKRLAQYEMQTHGCQSCSKFNGVEISS